MNSFNSKTMQEKTIQKNIKLKEEEEERNKDALKQLINNIKYRIETAAGRGHFFYEIESYSKKERSKISEYFESLGFKVIVNNPWIKISWE